MSQAEPAGYLHEVKEPEEDVAWRMYSRSPDNPWGHWVQSHKDKCTYKMTPLYATRAVSIERLIELFEAAGYNKHRVDPASYEDFSFVRFFESYKTEIAA